MMRRLTVALLCGAYLCLSLIVALTLWRNGGGWGAGLAALVGGLGLCFAFHGLIERALEGGALRSDVDTLREAHQLLLDQVERLDARVGQVAEAVEADASRGEQLTDEVELLERLVQWLVSSDHHFRGTPDFIRALLLLCAAGVAHAVTTRQFSLDSAGVLSAGKLDDTAVLSSGAVVRGTRNGGSWTSAPIA